MAVATEYKTPEVGFKKRTIPSKVMKVNEFGDHYKVEGALTNDRQIASEEEESDRGPSSLLAKEKKKQMKKEMVEEAEQPVEAPQPWLYRTKERTVH